MISRSTVGLAETIAKIRSKNEPYHIYRGVTKGFLGWHHQPKFDGNLEISTLMQSSGLKSDPPPFSMQIDIAGMSLGRVSFFHEVRHNSTAAPPQCLGRS